MPSESLSQVLSGWACVTCRNGDTIDGAFAHFARNHVIFILSVIFFPHISAICRNIQWRISRRRGPHHAVRSHTASFCCIRYQNAVLIKYSSYTPHLTPCSASGSELRATFIKGKAQGQGLYTYSDGSRYVGQFSNSQREGTGIYKYASAGGCASHM